MSCWQFHMAVSHSGVCPLSQVEITPSLKDTISKKEKRKRFCFVLLCVGSSIVKVRDLNIGMC